MIFFLAGALAASAGTVVAMMPERAITKNENAIIKCSCGIWLVGLAKQLALHFFVQDLLFIVLKLEYDISIAHIFLIT